MAAEGPALRARGGAAGDRARARAWQRWLAAAGPWSLWSVCPALVAPTSVIAPHPVQNQNAAAIADQLQAATNTLILIDLDPTFGVQVAARLSERRVAHVVLVLPRWPYSEALLPTAALTRALIDESTRLTADPPSSNVAFVLDADRAKPIVRQSAAQADNRYRLALADLPNLRALRTYGISRILKVA